MCQPLPYNPRLLEKAKALRKQMPYSERVLWNRLRRQQVMQYDFDRQKPILEYIVDFYCREARLAIEVDGITHADDAAYAQRRQQSIEDLGVCMLRFDALEVVKNADAVVTIIANWLIHFEEREGVPPVIINRRNQYH